MLRNAATTVSPEEALEEVGNVLLAQEDLAFFAEYISDGWYIAREMHHLIAHELHQVLRFLETDGEEGTQFLMILTPPQHGKSELVSRMFPAFGLGKMPNLRITQISYGDALAGNNSRAVRNMIVSDRYQAVFGALGPDAEQVMLSKDSRSVSMWTLAAPNRGGMVAAGVGGAVTGMPKGLFIIDDPVKDHREAQNEKIREDVWEFYKSAIRVRAKAIVLIMTHWHPDDLAGRLIKQMVQKPKTGKWRIVDLPALIEDGLFAKDREEQRKKMLDGVYMSLKDPLGRQKGEVLCPAMLTKSEMLAIKEGDDYFFSALYQQRPYLKEGQRYLREWVRTLTKIPDEVKIVFIVRMWDKANSTDGDYTAGVLIAYCSDGFFYILDVVRGRWRSGERDRQMLKTARMDRKMYGNVKIWHQQDPGSAGKDSAEATNRLLMGFPAKFEPVTGSKEDRSDPLESAFMGGLVYLIRGAWNADFIEECVSFPRGTHDDQVDAASGAYNKLLEMIGKKRESKIL